VLALALLLFVATVRAHPQDRTGGAE
jgi:hypothetical protein